ncbi:ABC transporter permease [Candidatus Parcubacteria bacterium]|nr:ABC transporter permease [Candidatus Parcubacteria bacterium]
MLATDLFRLATRMFRTNCSRTILTILGISVGIGAILFLVSLGYGVQELILNRITTSDALLSLDVSAGDVESFKMDNNAIDSIKKINGIEKVSPLISTQAQMIVNGISSELNANMASNDFFRLDGTALKKGEFYTDDLADKNKIVISSAALQLFNLNEENAFDRKINFSLLLPSKEEDANFTSEFTAMENDFNIVGIIEDENSSFVYLPFAIGLDYGFDNYSKIKVKVADEDSLDLVRTEIIDKGFIVSALSDIIEQANQIFKVVQIILASFGVVALIVSAIGMFNTMTITLLERTQEIGIMKTLGATSFDIWNMFLAESIIIGFFGGLGGVTIGWFGGVLFNYLINLLAGAFGGEKIDMFYTPYWFVILIMSFSSVVGLLTGFYPARRAAKINALEALRYK